MSKAKKVEVATFVLLTGFWLSEAAANMKSKTAPPNQSLKFDSHGSAKSGKYDTIFVDSLDGKRIFFRKFREKIADQFVDSTDIAIEGITENDSLFFKYSDSAGTKDFNVFKITSEMKSAYILHIGYSPSNPPSGQAFAIIAPVRGAMKLIPPEPFTFAGGLPGFTSEKISKSNDGFSVSIWNGNFGIEVPIEIHAQDDSTYLTVSKMKSANIRNSTAYYFPVTQHPDKAFYKGNEDVNLYLDLYKEKEMKIKTPEIEEIIVRGVWVRVDSKPKQPGIQTFFDACRESKNSLLEVKIGNKKGFIGYQDYKKIGYQDAG